MHNRQTVWIKQRETRLRDVKTLHIQTGSLLWTEGKAGEILAFDLKGKGSTLPAVWKAQIKGEVWRMIATDRALVVVTKSGTIHCFASGKSGQDSPRVWSPTKPAKPKKVSSAQIPKTLRADGYSVVLRYDSKTVEHLLHTTVILENFANQVSRRPTRMLTGVQPPVLDTTAIER